MSNDLILDIYFPKFADYLMRGETSPAFSKLAAIGAWQVDEAHSIYASLGQQLGLLKQQDWPLAPLARLGENLPLENGTYFLVHPAHFVLQRDHFTLGEVVRLKPNETSAILKSLNEHFFQDGLCFEPGENQAYWYLHSRQPLSVQTRLVAEVQGRDVRAFMPQGDNAMGLQSIMNQAQMLLHDHPVNQAREQLGELVVNSIWIDGGGQVPKVGLKSAPAFNVFSNDAIVKGWAALAACACNPPPKRLLDLSGGDVLLVMDGATPFENANDSFDDLLQALKQNKFKTLRCHFDVHGFTFTLTVSSKDTWKFWRKTRPIATYFK